MNYRLNVLNDKEFEELAQQILERELGVALQNFKPGKDLGIDFRYSSDGENKIVVQAKHYVRSKFPQLKSSLLSERKKMDSLASVPQRYILFTSLSLSVAETDEIHQLLSPYLQSPQDIYGLDRIEKLITDHPDIEKRFFKLWITSTNTLQLVLNNSAHSRNVLLRDDILKRVGLYVPTDSLPVARQILEDSKLLIITGDPGVGKTTLSHILIYELLAKGYELIHILDKISEAENLISMDPARKQVIFFDDFLGANVNDVMHQNSEGAINTLINRIKSMENKCLIMTSRTTILNQASSRLEKFHRSGVVDTSSYLLEVQEYSRYNKARILYNHIYHADLHEDKEVFFTEKFYYEIIDHQNYFPRLIEFITSSVQFKRSKKTDYRTFILHVLENPEAIWQFAYEEQLEDEERFLLCTLFSLGGYYVTKELLEKAFEARYAYEIKINGFVRKSDAFNRSLKKLTDSMISLRDDNYLNEVNVSLLNPSIADFLINYLGDRAKEQERILLSAIYLDQYLKYFATEDGIEVGKELWEKWFLYFRDHHDKMLAMDKDTDPALLRLYLVLYMFFPMLTGRVALIFLEELDFMKLGGLHFEKIVFCFQILKDFSECQKFIAERWPGIFANLLFLAIDEREFQFVFDLMVSYGVKSEEWMAHDQFVQIVGGYANGRYEETMHDVDTEEIEEKVFGLLRAGKEAEAFKVISEFLDDDYRQFLDGCRLGAFYKNLRPEINLKEHKVFATLKRDCFEPFDDRGFDAPHIYVWSEDMQRGDDDIDLLFERDQN